MKRNNNTFSTIIALSTAFALTVSLSAFKVCAWGDDSGGRQSYTIDEIKEGKLGDSIVFNSISDSVIGDEKNFCSASTVEEAAEKIWHGNSVTVEDGKEFLIRIYVHNNSSLGQEAVAENVKVAVSIPQNSAKKIRINGFISADNATPSTYWDYVDFNAESNFHLEYIYGSAVLYNNGIGKGASGYPIDDDVVTKATSGGAVIGYSKLDGHIPSGYMYASYVTIKVKTVFDAEYLADCKVRLAGTQAWSDSVVANPGEELEIQTEYKNLSFVGKTQENVYSKYVLSKNLEYVSGSALLYNDSNPDGLILDDSIVVKSINIGNYTSGSGAYVRIRAKVLNEGIEYGDNIFIGKAKIKVGKTTRQDCISVKVDR